MHQIYLGSQWSLIVKPVSGPSQKANQMINGNIGTKSSQVMISRAWGEFFIRNCLNSHLPDGAEGKGPCLCEPVDIQEDYIFIQTRVLFESVWRIKAMNIKEQRPPSKPHHNFNSTITTLNGYLILWIFIHLRIGID